MKAKRIVVRNPLVWSLLAASVATLHNLQVSLSGVFVGTRRFLLNDYDVARQVLDLPRVDRHQQEDVIDAVKPTKENKKPSSRREERQPNDGDQREQHEGSNNSQEVHDPPQVKALTPKEWKQLNKRLTEQRLIDFFHEPRQSDFVFSNQTTRIYFIHPGKTAGSFLHEKLGVEIAHKRDSLACHMDNAKSFDDCLGALGRGPSQLWRLTVGHRHLAGSRYTKPQHRYLRNEGTNLLLWTVRDPIARVVSAFNFHHYTTVVAGKTRGKKFFDCFDSIEHLAQASATTASWGNLTAGCRKQGYGFLKGTDREPGRHMFANYKYYVAEAWRPGKAIAVVRKEHLEHDTRELERRLGGDPATLGSFEGQIKSENYTRNTGLTSEGKRLICCAIVEDMSYFEQLVMLAVNLEDDERVAYLRKSRQECGIAVGENDNDLDITSFSWDKWHKASCPQITPKG